MFLSDTLLGARESVHGRRHGRVRFLRSVAPPCDQAWRWWTSPNETLIALSVSSLTNPLAATCIEAAEGLRGCDAYFSSIITDEDERLYRSLGINVCCEPRYETKRSDLD